MFGGVFVSKKIINSIEHDEDAVTKSEVKEKALKRAYLLDGLG